MANQAAKLFQAYAASQDMKIAFVDDDESVLRAGWKLDNTNLQIFFIFNDDCTNIQIRGVDFAVIPDGKQDVMLRVCNSLNSKFRFVKFYIPENESQVYAEADAVIQLDSCAEEAFELMIRMTSIVDEAYPDIMKGLWA